MEEYQLGRALVSFAVHLAVGHGELAITDDDREQVEVSARPN